MLKDMMALIYTQMKEAGMNHILLCCLFSVLFALLIIICLSLTAGEDGTLEQGCNRAGFLKVAHALKELGWVY